MREGPRTGCAGQLQPSLGNRAGRFGRNDLLVVAAGADAANRQLVDAALRAPLGHRRLRPDGRSAQADVAMFWVGDQPGVLPGAADPDLVRAGAEVPGLGLGEAGGAAPVDAQHTGAVAAGGGDVAVGPWRVLEAGDADLVAEGLDESEVLVGELRLRPGGDERIFVGSGVHGRRG